MKQSITKHLAKLAAEIGARPGGSPGNHAAAAYIESVFHGCGMAVEVQEFACPAWEARETWLSVGDGAVWVAANPYSPSCTVTAPLVPVGTLAELEHADLGGKVAVLYGDLTRQPLPPKAWMFKDEADARVVDLLEAAQPAAIVAVQSNPGELNRLVEDWEFAIPSVTAPATQRERLLGLAGALAHLHIVTRQQAGSTANIVARLPGVRREQLVLMAHYDTKVDTPGATDNGAGVAVLLALAEHCCRQDQPYALEFIAFTNEEYLPLGDDEYVRHRGESFDQIVAAVNFDGVGQVGSVLTVAGFNLAPACEVVLRTVTAAPPAVTWVDPWPESNHSTFAWRGVPALAFTARADHYQHHLRTDTVDQVDVGQLLDVAALAGRLTRTMAAHDAKWPRTG
jgi:aminopeptidase YwaD